MKYFSNALIGLLALCFLAPLANAQSFVSKRHNAGLTNASVIFPGQAGKQIVLRQADVTGDNADALLKIASGAVVTLLTSTEATSATVLEVVSSTGFAATQSIVIQRASGVCTEHFVAAAGTNKVVVTTAIGTAAAAGDQVWYMSNVATNAIASATVRLNGTLWAGQVRAPLSLRLYSGAGTTEAINAATAEYVWNSPTQ